jgi:hypothetical protein
MKQYYRLAILITALLVIGPRAYAAGYPHATSYYDDLVDHYEQTLIMSDFIDEGIR